LNPLVTQKLRTNPPRTGPFSDRCPQDRCCRQAAPGRDRANCIGTAPSEVGLIRVVSALFLRRRELAQHNSCDVGHDLALGVARSGADADNHDRLARPEETLVGHLAVPHRLPAPD
jgi:hypothetical protein